MSNFTATDCQTSTEFTAVHKRIAASFYILIIIIALCGNGIVLIVIYKNHAMRTVTNLLICNSAVADLLITLLAAVWEVIVLLKYKTWPLGTFMCPFMHICIYLSVAATVITLMIITVDRYNAVIHPYKKYLTNKMLVIVIPGIWMASFLFASPITFVQKVVYVKGYGSVCTEEWPSPFSFTESPKHYTVILFICLYAVPLMLMTIMYTVMAKRLARPVGVNHRQQQKNVSEQPFTLNSMNMLLSAVDFKDIKSSFIEEEKQFVSFTARKRRVIKMLISIVIAFAICWFPVYCIQFMLYFNPYFMRCALPQYAQFIAFFMQYSNSAINPLLYFGFSMTYRKGLINAFPCCFKEDRRTRLCIRLM